MMLCWLFGVSRACSEVYRFRLFGVWLFRRTTMTIGHRSLKPATMG
jgi:hypothetical protein